MGNSKNASANPIDGLIRNLRFLKSDIVKKIVLVEGFTLPAIASFGMDSFSMGVPASHRY